MSDINYEKLDINEQFSYAFHSMENTDKNIFITGKAGTGKSTLLQYFREKTKKNIVVLAPTGVAAVNIKGQTIHSFFNFKPDITPLSAKKIKPRNKDLYKNLDAIIIDEISMVRSDLLDSIDIFLRKYGKKKKEPFGGIKMIFIGDLYQLPPVVTNKEKEIFKAHYKSPFFFDTKVFEAHFEMELIELEKIYRQKDDDFIHLLNAIRNNTITDQQIQKLNSRLIPDFKEDPKELFIHLTTTNEIADAINAEKLSKINGKILRCKGHATGDFQKKELPTNELLELKIGAQVMLLNNDSFGRWINGSLGVLKDIEKDEEQEILVVELATGEEVGVRPYQWDMFRFFYDDDKKAVFAETIGSFIQYPLRLAWAITIHKGQGKTFDKVIIDIGKGTFSHGQVYVALSRCTSFEGLVLKRPIEKKHIMMDYRVVNFITRFQYAQSEKKCSLSDKKCILENAIREKKPLEIVYLKTKDDKSRRIIMPISIGMMEFNGKEFLGLRAFCTQKKEERTFRIDRILEIKD